MSSSTFTLDLGPRDLPDSEHLKLVHRGKVRDSYEDHTGMKTRLFIATNRISVFDFVLNAEVPRKGEVLTALNVFWRERFRRYPGATAAYGKALAVLAEKAFKGNRDIWRRAMVTDCYEMFPVEAIVRGYLTGSGLTAYRKDGKVCGHELPAGLRDGSKLPQPLFTPTTKAVVGHDEHIDASTVSAAIAELSITLYKEAANYAATRGIIIADTKFEFGKNNISWINAILMLADELLTPDSSRFWDADEYATAFALGKTPRPFDKQFVREYAKALGIDKRDPTNSDDYAWVRAQVIDPAVLQKTTEIYLEIFERLTGYPLAKYQEEVMGIPRD